MMQIDRRNTWSQRFWYRTRQHVAAGTAVTYRGEQVGEVVQCIRRDGDLNVGRFEVEARARRDFVAIVDANGVSGLELPGF